MTPMPQPLFPISTLVALVFAAIAPPLVSSAAAQTIPVPAIQLPTVTVTAQKEPADLQTLPVSVTAVPGETLGNAGISMISDAAIYAPNTYFSDFTARKLSNPRFRGIGSSPANPGITTYIDGVPQLNANSSSIELLDVEPGRVRARPAERAVRPQHARWPRQHHERPPVAERVDRRR